MRFAEQGAAHPFWTGMSLDWHLISRLGEAQILLPAALLASAWLAWRLRAPAASKAWLGWLGLAVVLTTASKLAFMGWGIGIAALDFTGFSGHAMFAAAVYPVLVRILAVDAPAAVRRIAIAAGFALAVAIAQSRLEIHAHSVSEVIAGSALGSAVSLLTLWRQPWPATRASPWVPIVLLAWLAAVPWSAPPSLTHNFVTHLALALSQRTHPFTRSDLHRPEKSAERVPLAQALPRVYT